MASQEKQRRSAPVPTLAQAERETIEQALRLCDGNIARAAMLLDVAPSTIYRKRQGWVIDVRR